MISEVIGTSLLQDISVDCVDTDSDPGGKLLASLLSRPVVLHCIKVIYSTLLALAVSLLPATV